MRIGFMIVGLAIWSIVGLVGQTAWTYYEVDSTKAKWGDWNEPNWLRYFGLCAVDVNRDQKLDIASGRYLYLQPNKLEDGHWKRIDIGSNVDIIGTMDVDGDRFVDLIAQGLPSVYWIEATTEDGYGWRMRSVAQIPATSHVNSQGFTTAALLTGEQQQIVIAGAGDIYAIKIPKSPDTQQWSTYKIAANTSDEGIGVGDIDGDGDLDIAAGRYLEGDEPTGLLWYENNGRLDIEWTPHRIGTSIHAIDRVVISDMDGDSKADIVVTEERYPGLEPDANLIWYRQADYGTWQRKIIATQYSMNNLSVYDIDGDGDSDILTSEHKGDELALQWWYNQGEGRFKKRIIDRGKESHLGTLLYDMDQDGDQDIISAGWDAWKYMHYWENEQKKKP